MVENKRVKRHKAKTQKTDRAMVTIDVRVKSVIQQTNVVEALMGSCHTEFVSHIISGIPNPNRMNHRKNLPPRNRI